MIDLPGAARRPVTSVIRLALPGVAVSLMQLPGVLPVMPLAGNRKEEQGGGEEIQRFHPRRMYPLLAR